MGKLAPLANDAPPPVIFETLAVSSSSSSSSSRTHLQLEGFPLVSLELYKSQLLFSSMP